MFDNKIKKTIAEYLSNTSINSFELAKQELIKFRNIKINNYTIQQSRNIWFTLLIYRYKSIMDIPDILWSSAREVILGILTNNVNIVTTISSYLEIFTNWKKTDFDSFIMEVSGFYYNLLQIKESIEMTKNETSINEWKDNYNKLINQVREAAKKMGFLDKIDEFVTMMTKKKQNVITNIMEIAYWDMIEKDICEQKYDVILCNIIELKQNLEEILPKNYKKDDINEHIDIKYIKQRIETNTFDIEYLLGLFNWIIQFLKFWDSDNNVKLYDSELEEIKHLSTVDQLPKLICNIIKKSILLTNDLKIRKSLWLKILKKL